MDFYYCEPLTPFGLVAYGTSSASNAVVVDGVTGLILN